MIQAKDIKNIEVRFIELLQHIPRTKVEKQSYFLSQGISIPRTNYYTMWQRLVDKLGRVGAAKALFGFLESHMPRRLGYLIDSYRKDERIKILSNEPIIIYDFFHYNGNLRRLGELYLNHSDDPIINRAGGGRSTLVSTKTKKSSNRYEVALSFAGENRLLVEAVAHRLRKQGVKVFYDAFENVDLWGRDLTSHFAEIYRDKADYCAMFISKHYVRKAWPDFERQHALSRAIKQRGGYILPIKLDDSDVPGLPTTIGYLDAKNMSGEDIAKKIYRKIRK